MESGKTIPVLRTESVDHVFDFISRTFGDNSANSALEKSRAKLSLEMMDIQRSAAKERYSMEPNTQASSELATTARSDSLATTTWKISGRLLTFKHFEFSTNDNTVRPRTPVFTRVVGPMKRQGRSVFVPHIRGSGVFPTVNRKTGAVIPMIPFIREGKRFPIRSLRTLSIPQFYSNDTVEASAQNRIMDRFFALLSEEVDSLDVQGAT